MNNCCTFFSIASLLTAFAAPVLHGQTPATLNVEVSRPKAAVSPMLYGLMTEEINYSYDGGLYAELVRNRTFRSDWTGILNWFLIEKGTASAKVSVDAKEGPSAALPSSAKLEVTKADANSPAGLLNEGYWGIAVRPNSRYTGSFFAKSDAQGSLPVRIALVADQSGQVLAKASVSVDGQRLEGIQVRDAVRKCRRVLGEPSRVDHRPACDSVAPVGFAVPAHLPRPGQREPHRHHGEAGRHASRVPALPRRKLPRRQPYRDPIRLEEDDRPAGRSSHAPHHVELPLHDGMGLLEFLEWCEDLHMQPLLAIYGGYSLGGQVVKPGPDLDPYVQEGLEEIEYVTGGTGHQVGRGAGARRASGSVLAALRGDRQRRQFRPGQDLRRPVRAVL